MIRINLLPKEERVTARRVAMPKIGAMVPVAAVAVVLAVVGVTAALEHAKVGSLRNDVAQLQDEVRAIQPQVDRVKKLTAQREELHQRLDVIRQLDDGRFFSVRIMDNLSREIPKYVWLVQMNQNGQSSVSMSGVTFSNLIVAELMKRLEASAMFANVDLVETKRGLIEEREVITFNVTADLSPDDTPSDLTADAFIEELLEGEDE